MRLKCIHTAHQSVTALAVAWNLQLIGFLRGYSSFAPSLTEESTYTTRRNSFQHQKWSDMEIIRLFGPLPANT